MSYTDEWKVDEQLHEALLDYNRKAYSREMILDLMEKDFNQYCWSMATLKRRLSFFNIKMIDHSVPINDVREAVQKELEGPGIIVTFCFN